MWAYYNRLVVVTLGSVAPETFRGRMGWSWSGGFLKLKEPEVMDDDVPKQVEGFLLIPRYRLSMIQVVK